MICQGFFRRSIKERAPSRYKCMDNGTCEINVATRNACRYCRFQRCIKVGMSVEGIEFIINLVRIFGRCQVFLLTPIRKQKDNYRNPWSICSVFNFSSKIISYFNLLIMIWE